MYPVIAKVPHSSTHQQSISATFRFPINNSTHATAQTALNIFPSSKQAFDENMDSMPAIQRSPVFWFSDGNVVLQTADTQFRVHRSLLAFHWEIMKDCFEIPQAEEVEETVEGCPVLRLDDSTRDVENLCGLLFGVYEWVNYDILSWHYINFQAHPSLATGSNPRKSDSHTWKLCCVLVKNMKSQTSKQWH